MGDFDDMNTEQIIAEALSAPVLRILRGPRPRTPELVFSAQRCVKVHAGKLQTSGTAPQVNDETDVLRKAQAACGDIGCCGFASSYIKTAVREGSFEGD